jgi:hypothetical protein
MRTGAMFHKDLDIGTIHALGNRLEAVEILSREAGGYGLVLHLRSRFNTPIVEPCRQVFDTLNDAETCAELDYGIYRDQVRRPVA